MLRSKIELFALVVSFFVGGCTCEGGKLAEPPPDSQEDPCQPSWDSPGAQDNCTRWMQADGEHAYCYLPDGTIWGWWPDGTRVRWDKVINSAQLCYIRKGVVVYRMGDPLPTCKDPEHGMC